MEVLAKLPPADQQGGDLKLVLKAISAFRRGESGVTLPAEWEGLYGKIAAEFNELSAQAGRTHNRFKALENGARNGARAASRRVAEDKLTGFWQEDVACVNSVVDQLDRR